MARRELIDSTWKNTRNVSEWHFDPNVSDPDFKIVGRICGNWKTEIQKLTGFVPAGYDHHGEYGGFKSIKGREAMGEKQQWGFAQDQIYYYATRHIPSVFKRVAKLLCLEEPDVRIHRQTAGQGIHTHIDTFTSYSRRGRDPSFDITKCERFVVALSDYDWGQFWQIGNHMWEHWKSGEIMFSRMRDIPHCTAHVGRTPRFMMLVTGIMTPESWELVNGPFREFRVDA